MLTLDLRLLTIANQLLAISVELLVHHESAAHLTNQQLTSASKHSLSKEEGKEDVDLAVTVPRGVMAGDVLQVDADSASSSIGHVRVRVRALLCPCSCPYTPRGVESVTCRSPRC